MRAVLWRSGTFSLTGISFLNPDSDSHQDYLVCNAKIEPGFERESRSTAPQQTGSASR